jgi:hypothetical protein
MKLFVGDANGTGSGPVVFADGATSSGLGYYYFGLSNTGDSLLFSNNGGTSYTYTPIPDSSGYDANVTNVRIILGGQFAGKTGSGSPSMTLQLLMQVK